MKHTVAVFITGILLLSLTACGAGRWVRTPVLESSRTTVNLEHHEGKGQIPAQQYDHPYAMSIQEMGTLLGDLLYQEKAVLIGGKKNLPVFQTEEIAALAPALADGLSKATPDQRIQFTSFNKGGGLLFKNTRKTEGVLFVEPGGRVNLAFNLINMDVMEADSEDLPQLYTNSDPLKIKHADTTLVPPAYAALKMLDTEKPAPMWILADTAKLKEAVAAAPKPAAPPVVVSPAPAATPVATPAITPPPTEAAAPVPPVAPEADIKNKLKYLKDLYEDGLISESEYAAEKQKLLDKIN